MPNSESETISAGAILRQLAAGGGAGAITKTAIAPLERIKILMQLEVSPVSAAIYGPKVNGCA
jgi:hypothetical protein